MTSAPSSGVTILLNVLGEISFGGTFAVMSPSARYGVFKLSKAGLITSFTVVLEGSMDGNTFFPVATLTQADLDANKSAATLAMLFPFVRANMTQYIGGGGTITAYLQE